jgi:hypothetical protein
MWDDYGYCYEAHDWVDTSHMEYSCDLYGNEDDSWVQSGYWWDHWVTVHDWKYEWVPTSIDDPNYHGGPPYSYGNYVDGSYGSGGYSWYGSSSYAAYVHAEAVAAYQRAKRQAAVQLQQKMQREAEAATQVAKEYEQSANMDSGNATLNPDNNWGQGDPNAPDWGEATAGGVMMVSGVALTVTVGYAMYVCAPEGVALSLIDVADAGEFYGYGVGMLAAGGAMTIGGGIMVGKNVGKGVRNAAEWGWDNTFGRL